VSRVIGSSQCPLSIPTSVARSRCPLHARFNGVGNYAESSLQAVHVALGKAYRPDCVKVLILLSDGWCLREGIKFETSAMGCGGQKRSFSSVAPLSRTTGSGRNTTAGQWYQIRAHGSHFGA